MSRAKTAESPAEGAEEAATDAVNANTEAGIDAGEPTAETTRAVSPAGAEGEAAAEAAPVAGSEPTAEAGAAGPTDVARAAAEGEAEQAEATATEAEQAEGEPTAEAETEATPAKPRPAWRRLPALILAAAIVLTGAGVWFTLEARSAASTPAAANLALTDVGATADVTSAVSLAVNRIFSYSYDRTDVTEKAAAAVLRGAAKDSYDKLFAEVRRKAPEQKLVLTSRVSAIAVQELENGHARLLVFLDQSAVRADNNATDSAAAQLSVTAEHTRDGWVITELEPR
jgi:Mce-associated membrane protein